MKSSVLKELLAIAFYPLLFLILCWVLFFADVTFHLDLFRFGVSPRTLNGLIGIVCSPFIHADFNHIANNSFPILLLGSLIFYFYKPIAWPAIFWIYIISGIWLWVGGRNSDAIPNYHFGASTLIYGFSTFLFFSGVFRKHKQLMVVSALVVFMYGSITWGIFPFDRSISWEGHLFGAISGILVAYHYRKEGPQKPEYHRPEEEIDLEHLDDDLTNDSELVHSNDFFNPYNVVYHYKPTNSMDASITDPIAETMMPQINISKIGLSDVEQLQVIGIQTFLETFSADNLEENMRQYLEVGFSIDKLSDELVNPNSAFYVATINHHIIGYLKINVGLAQTEPQEYKAIEIERIYVLKQFHGKQVGQYLYNKALDLAKQGKFEYIWLGVWEKNPRAIQFYTKNGFKAFGKHVFQLGDDEQTDIMMKLMLDTE